MPAGMYGGGGWIREGMLCKQPTNTVYEENMYTTIDLVKEKAFTKRIEMKDNSARQFT